MSDLLFEVPEVLSPRLKAERARLELCEEYGIKTHFSDMTKGSEWMAILPVEEDASKSVAEIICESCRLYEESGRIAFGSTKTEAIFALADQLKIQVSTK